MVYRGLLKITKVVSLGESTLRGRKRFDVMVACGSRCTLKMLAYIYIYVYVYLEMFSLCEGTP